MRHSTVGIVIIVAQMFGCLDVWMLGCSDALISMLDARHYRAIASLCEAANRNKPTWPASFADASRVNNNANTRLVRVSRLRVCFRFRVCSRPRRDPIRIIARARPGCSCSPIAGPIRPTLERLAAANRPQSLESQRNYRGRRDSNIAADSNIARSVTCFVCMPLR